MIEMGVTEGVAFDIQLGPQDFHQRQKVKEPMRGTQTRRWQF